MELSTYLFSSCAKKHISYEAGDLSFGERYHAIRILL